MTYFQSHKRKQQKTVLKKSNIDLNYKSIVNNEFGFEA